MSEYSSDITKSLNLVESGVNSFKNGNEYKLFSTRLCTYIEEQRWVRNSAILSPAICSQYGWTCINHQFLSCNTCSAKLCFTEPNILNYCAYKECIDDVCKCLKTAHKKHCPWPINPCPDAFVKITPLHKDKAFSEFAKRFETLLALGHKLPKIKDRMMLELGLTEDVKDLMYKEMKTSKSEIGDSAMVLAACGWKLDLEAKLAESLCCLDCQRTVALLLFQSLSSSENGADALAKRQKLLGTQNGKESVTNPYSEEHQIQESVAPLSSPIDYSMTSIGNSFDEVSDRGTQKDVGTTSQSAKRKAMISESFDPLYEHRPWCRWVVESGLSRQSIETSGIDDLTCEIKVDPMPGWKLFVECLLRRTYVPEKGSPLKKEIQSARDMLESWKSTT